jgi:hypothetical protein
MMSHKIHKNSLKTKNARTKMEKCRVFSTEERRGKKKRE